MSGEGTSADRVRALTEELNRLREENANLRVRVNHEMERVRKLAVDAEAGDNSKSVFLTNMSHSIRTPMNGMLGVIELLFETGLNDRQRDYLNMVRSSTESLLTVINNVLDYALIEAGRVPFQRSALNMREVCREVRDQLQLQVGDRPVSVELDYADDVTDVVYGDPVRLRQILLNLGGNGVKFTKEGRVTIRVHQKEGRFELLVEDTGSGIAEERMADLFNPFARIDQDDAHHVEGTGLGLAITGRLVELMGGSISVTSRLGEGSVFSVFLPLLCGQDEAVAELVEGPESLPESLDLDVLFAEDNVINRKVGIDQLTRLGCRVCPVEDGLEALQMLGIDIDDLGSVKLADRYGKYDVVILDNHMPRMSGMEACGILRGVEAAWIGARRIPAGSHLPVLAMTAMAMEGDRALCLEAGMDDYLAKPVSRGEIQRVLHGLVSRFAHKALQQKAAASCSVLRADVPHFRRERLMEMVDGRVELAAELTDDFLRLTPGTLATLRKALAEQEADEAARAVHKIAGSASYVGAERMQLIGKEMERRIRSGDLPSGAELLSELEASFAEVERSFHESRPFGNGRDETRSG